MRVPNLRVVFYKHKSIKNIFGNNGRVSNVITLYYLGHKGFKWLGSLLHIGCSTYADGRYACKLNNN